MNDTDWREILSLSQKELREADKDKLCESLSWMEADDIELNFTDLKTLFRLAQDMLKYKSEQVNNLLGQLEYSQRKSKSKSKHTAGDSPAKSSDSILETIAHQEEVIKANKEILEQLYADIAELEGRKNKLEDQNDAIDKDSESSRDALSEINAVAQMENEITIKNKHIRKLLADIKLVEDENTKYKEKVLIIKDKLSEATKLIENFTEQLLNLNHENSKLKELLGKSEEAKAELSDQIGSFRKQLFEKDSSRQNIDEEIKSKVLHWKNIARAKKAEIEKLAHENMKLKENLKRSTKSRSSSPLKIKNEEDSKMKELQHKLLEASKEITQSAKIIELLKLENQQLKSIPDETPESVSEVNKNESDDGKERAIIAKLKKKNKILTLSLQEVEEMLLAREKELLEITSQLQLVQSKEGIRILLEGIKNKKRMLKYRDEGIKSLVQEVNSLNQLVDELQLQNETLRQKLNIPPDVKIPATGILRKHHEVERKLKELDVERKETENKLVSVEIDNRNLRLKNVKLVKILIKLGYNKDKLKKIYEETDSDSEDLEMNTETKIENTTQDHLDQNKQMKDIIEENEGLRKGLQDILNFLKDNSTTSSGVLTLQCPSLEAILRTMEARHVAGWFAPHMSTVLELRAALGGKDALLTALHEARKKTFDVMDQLKKESQKCHNLQQKINAMEAVEKPRNDNKNQLLDKPVSISEFGSWMNESDQCNINLFDKDEIESLLTKSNVIHESQLKNGLAYFHERFKILFDKMTVTTIQTTDDFNKWSIQKEQYQAEIENLKAQLCQREDEDISDVSPGVVQIPSSSVLQRKCTYLEESYLYIRTLNENLKNEILQSKKDAMTQTFEFETKIQKLILAITNLTDKLRFSVPFDLFWKQNKAMNEAITKYRKILNEAVKSQENSQSLLKMLEHDKISIINKVRQDIMKFSQTETNDADESIITIPKIEESVVKNQIEQLCGEIQSKNKRIDYLEIEIEKLQELQGNLIDDTLPAITNEEVDLLKENLQKLVNDNNLLKEQCQHVGSQLDIALLQDNQQRQLNNDIEINMLKHQILDLQSTSDNKAILAKLSNEILVAHLQASESFKKIERLNVALNNERQLRIESEEMLKARQKVFDMYSQRYESKFRYMYQVMEILRQQYQGSVPLASIENYLNKIEEHYRKSQVVDDKLTEIEDLQSSLMTKHTLFEQVLDLSKNKCLEEEDGCPHKIKNIVMEGMHSRDLDHLKKKISILEKSREELTKQCNSLEKILVLLNQGFEKNNLNTYSSKNKLGEDKNVNMKIEDIHSDDDLSGNGTQTISLSRPQVLKPPKGMIDMTTVRKEDLTYTLSDKKEIGKSDQTKIQHKNESTQTNVIEISKINKSVQVVEHKNLMGMKRNDDEKLIELKNELNELSLDNDKKNQELLEAISVVKQRTEENLRINTDKIKLETIIQNLKKTIDERNKQNNMLSTTIDNLHQQLEESRHHNIAEKNKLNNMTKEENKSMLLLLQQVENDKNAIVTEYKDLLQRERDEYSKSISELNIRILELRSELDRKTSDIDTPSGEAHREILTKYTLKITELEDKCFKLQNEMDNRKSELKTYQNELDRWKDLASERLIKMEQLNYQLQQRHCQEVESYKTENQHWLSQLNESQRQQMELRTRLSEQKSIHIKQVAEKDAQIEQLRTVVQNLKAQIMNMQTMISVNDPSFDLSAIVEVEEPSDVSQHGSDRLEIKFESTIDLRDIHDDIVRLPSATSTAIWQEPVIDRLRREKQMTSKQNVILRRQIKALAARERRARLDAQNLKSQLFRITTSGGKAVSSETAALHNKITALQTQLSSARRDSQSSVAIWDKWKRAQQAAERWQSRYEEKFQEVKKLESSLNLAKSAIARLDKEKRVLLSRLSEVKNESLLAVEKQESEALEKSSHSPHVCECQEQTPVSSRSLLERVEAQQRRIIALEFAEKGNEHLVSEYEKALAEITSLKGQVLKLESTLLESQIRSPLKTTQEAQPEVDYWKSYCDMLKEENIQLNMRVAAAENVPTTAHQQRVQDLEQTILTLRGLVSKFQAEQKSTAAAVKRVDSRPNSGRSPPDKVKTQSESHRIEIANLKRSIMDKDLLLEKSKEMLKIAAEREDELLRENAYLRRQLNDLTKHKSGFMSA
ncbi:centrosomal protein of 290 kDa isoform X2 [Plodia interpunctella]|uniref:centrosomal protein of 290 kDa isoform X2 n=1 Tax=Plodia interpunctella TaxID=58824 RepID=UPI0023689E18|nr:centrosomal protein of 290 kDa-like isoform X2 [Plodia interpunctella]